MNRATQPYIAFLRAINVGGHVVKMDHLRRLFEALKLRSVETFIASGNVIFETDVVDPAVLEQRIENQLTRALGYDVATFLRTPAELGAIGAHQAFTAGELAGASLYVAFVKQPIAAAAEKRLLTFRSEVDDFHVHKREVYWLVRSKLMDSAFSGARLEKTIGMPATMRNITTVNRLVAKYAA